MGKYSPFKEVDGVMYRKCNKCQKYKVFDEYYNSISHTGGIQNKCKSCFSLYQKQNKDKIKEYRRCYSIENKETIKEKNKNWVKNNRERYNKRMSDRKINNPIFKLQHNLRSSNHQNLKRALEYYNNGKSDKLPTKSPSRMLLKLYEIQNHNCPYCSNNMKDDIHIDHIIPLSKGGSNEVYNLILCCSSCNLRKNAKELDVWLEECNINYDEFISGIERRNEMYFSDVVKIK